MTQSAFPIHKRLGLWLGLAVFALVLALPNAEGLTTEGQRVAAVALLMGIWWISEAIPIPATSLTPLALFPLLGVMDGKDLASSYGDSNIYLFAGGFFIAMAMQKWSLHERIALRILLFTGTNPHRLVLGFMIATASLSLWISNTATAMMMLPIGTAVIEQVRKRNELDDNGNFGVAVMLGIAFAASIGGVGTLVGTPPNIVFVGIFSKLYPEAPKVGFGQWMTFGIPLVALIIPIAWLLLTRVQFPLKAENDSSAGRDAIRNRLNELGPIKRGELVVLVVWCLTALCWIFREDLKLGLFTVPGWSRILPHPNYANDGTVAVVFALALFFIPIDRKRGEFALDWEWAQRIPWGVLLLFGGGFAIAKGFNDTGLVAWLGDHLSALNGASPLFMVMAVAVTVTFLSEFASNTALTTIMLPVLAVTASSTLGINPLLLMIPATFSASLAFMMPAGTPPNALVYGTGYVTLPQMARAGLVMNFVCIALVIAITYLIIIPVMGISPGELPVWAKP
ncbi:MAG: SLC13 family permease [Candidatus Hydrogenedentales bacterium]|jgi:sodium-dependent dicarboxylate transporter 2/3/5